MYSADDHYDDEITSGTAWEYTDCDDCYPFECRGYHTCNEFDPFSDAED